MITFIYNPYFLIIIKKEVFSIIGMQTDDTLILILEEFLVLEDNKLNKTKVFIKFKEALVLKTPLIFNRCVPIQYKDTI